MFKKRKTITEVFGEYENTCDKNLIPIELKNLLFSNLSDSLRDQWCDKVEFKLINDIPSCRKYFPSLDIHFVNAEKEFCGWKMVVISLKVGSIIKADENHFLSLHPARYDKVKKAISEGEIDMPIVYLGCDGIPSVQDGRHRIVALYKFGFNYIDVSVPEEQFHTIKSFYD